MAGLQAHTEVHQASKVDVFMLDKSDDGDEEQVDEHRKIASVTWAKRQGYQVVTQLVGQVSPRGWH